MTLDSSDEESEEDELDVPHRAIELEEEQEGEDEEYEDEDEDKTSWPGIKSNTDASRSTPQHGNLAYNFDENFMLPPSDAAGLSSSFNFASNQPQSFFQPDVLSLPPDFVSQTLDPAIFQPQPSFPPVNDLSGPMTASLFHSVLSFPTDPSALPSTTPLFLSTVTSETLGFDTTPSTVLPKPGDFKGDGVAVGDTSAEHEFLTGLLPNDNQVSVHENIQAIRPPQSREFLPNIIPDLATESLSESLISPERRLRTETHVDTIPDVHHERS